MLLKVAFNAYWDQGLSFEEASKQLAVASSPRS
jgi:hypothetical protein